MKKKLVLISGASSGIGREAAFYLQSKGYTVFAGVRNKSDGDNIKASSLDQIKTINLNITNKSDIDNCYKKIKQVLEKDQFLELSIINNAGIAIAGPVEYIPINEYQNILNVNILGHILVIQKFLPLLRKYSGRIINISSISGRISFPMLSPYVISKYALEGLTDALRMELLNTNIKVILIEPGRISTPIWGKAGDKIKKLFETFPEEAFKLYKDYFTVLDNMNENRDKIGSSPVKVSKVIYKALFSKRPKIRYKVGTSVTILLILKSLLTDRQFDWLLCRGYKQRV